MSEAFKCPMNRKPPMKCAGPAIAELGFLCDDCLAKKLDQCAGPVRVSEEAAANVPKKRGRKPKVRVPAPQSEERPVPLETPSQEELCRRALLELTVPMRPDYGQMIRPFRKEIQAARDAGRGWGAIVKVLRGHGYNIGPEALQHAMERQGAAS